MIMRINKIIIIITLLLSLILIAINFFVKNPYVGIVGHVLQLIGSLMLIGTALAEYRKAKKDKRQRKTD